MSMVSTAPAWSQKVENNEVDDDMWWRHTRYVAEVRDGWTSECGSDDVEPVLVELEAHRAENPDD